MANIKCCYCIPIDIGIKILAVLTILDAISLSIFCFKGVQILKVFLPPAIFGLIMSLVWVFQFFHDRLWTRKLSFWAYLVLKFVFQLIWYTAVLFNGYFTALLCNDEYLELFNKGKEPDISIEDCNKLYTLLLILDRGIALIITGYFVTQIWKWSKIDE